MGLGILCERGAHGVDRDGADRHTGQIAAAGDEGRGRVEVRTPMAAPWPALAVGLDGVRRGLPGAAVGQERGEPLRSRRVGVRGRGGAFCHGVETGFPVLSIWGRNTLPAR